MLCVLCAVWRVVRSSPALRSCTHVEFLFRVALVRLVEARAALLRLGPELLVDGATRPAHALNMRPARRRVACVRVVAEDRRVLDHALCAVREGEDVALIAVHEREVCMPDFVERRRRRELGGVPVAGLHFELEKEAVLLHRPPRPRGALLRIARGDDCNQRVPVGRRSCLPLDQLRFLALVGLVGREYRVQLDLDVGIVAPVEVLRLLAPVDGCPRVRLQHAALVPLPRTEPCARIPRERARLASAPLNPRPLRVARPHAGVHPLLDEVVVVVAQLKAFDGLPGGCTVEGCRERLWAGHVVAVPLCGGRLRWKAAVHGTLCCCCPRGQRKAAGGRILQHRHMQHSVPLAGVYDGRVARAELELDEHMLLRCRRRLRLAVALAARRARRLGLDLRLHACLALGGDAVAVGNGGDLLRELGVEASKVQLDERAPRRLFVLHERCKGGDARRAEVAHVNGQVTALTILLVRYPKYWHELLRARVRVH
mmetsp:Transcript_42877/g.141942  ORF Transcript_42877/g.141942 Transcript_42877/m.141942 type:complete len:485 (+) Transcript_42877:132-1586(+)